MFKKEVDIIHTFWACVQVPLHKEAKPQQMILLCCTAQSIELNIDEDRAWNVLSRSCFGEGSVERIVSSINGLVTGYMLVSFVALVSFVPLALVSLVPLVSLAALPSLGDHVGFGVGDAVGVGVRFHVQS